LHEQLAQHLRSL